MKKLLFRLLHYLLILAMAASLLVGVLLIVVKLTLPGLLRDGLAETTGFPVTMKSSSCSVFGLSLKAEGIVISNPEGFPSGSFAEVANVLADLDFDDQGQLIFESLDLHLTKLTLASSATGQSNLSVFGREAGPLAAGALDHIAAIFGDGTFPRVTQGEIRIDSVILPDGQPAAGFPRTFPLRQVISGQNLLRQLEESVTP